jgi:hypothetical protein
MNAIFDAPFDPAQGGAYRRAYDRGAGFKLSSRETVELEIGACDEYVGITVSDQFGSLQRESVLKHLGLDHTSRGVSYQVKEGDSGAGLGLYKINQLAMALLFATEPGVRTEVSVLFKRAKNYLDFRMGFCFFSIMGGGSPAL